MAANRSTSVNARAVFKSVFFMQGFSFLITVVNRGAERRLHHSFHPIHGFIKFRLQISQAVKHRSVVRDHHVGLPKVPAQNALFSSLPGLCPVAYDF